MNQALFFALLTGHRGNSLGDFANRARGLKFSTNKHGFADLTGFVEATRAETDYVRTRPGVPFAGLFWNSLPAWEGRLESVAPQADGFNFKALGGWRPLGDTPYTALWSTARTDEWRPVTTNELSTAAEQKWGMNNLNQLFIGLKKNETYTQNTHAGWYSLRTPNNGSRYMATIAFDYEMLATSAVYRFRVATYTSETFGGGAVINDLNASGSTQSGALCLPLTGNVVLAIMGLYNYNSATHNYTGETAAHYLKLTNVRVTTNALAVSTTLSAGASAAATSISVASAAGMVVGMWLYLGGSNPERVTITSIVGTTIGITALVNAKSSSDTVRAQAVYADEIVRDVLAAINSLNSSQIKSSTTSVQSPGLDLRDEVYEDEWPPDILTHLAFLGDNQTPPRQWEVGAYEDQRLFFWPRGNRTRVWYAETEGAPEYDIGDLRNSAYAIYREAGGRRLRTATNTKTNSANRYGLTRRAAVSTSTTNATQAAVHRDALLTDAENPPPNADNFRIVRLFDSAGVEWPKWFLRAGDLLYEKTTPRHAIPDSESQRRHWISETVYDVDTDEMTASPERPGATLDVLVARQAEGF